MRVGKELTGQTEGDKATLIREGGLDKWKQEKEKRKVQNIVSKTELKRKTRITLN